MSNFSDPAGIGGRMLARQTYRHTASILIGFAEDPYGDEAPTLHIASAGLVEFQMAKVAIPRTLFAAIMQRIAVLRSPPMAKAT